MNDEYKPPVDFEELSWLVGRLRREDTDRSFWLDHIRADYGADVADTALRCIEAEDVHRIKIEAARALWKQTLDETYLFMLDAYNSRTEA